MTQSKLKLNFGIDAPGLFRGFLTVGIGAAALFATLICLASGSTPVVIANVACAVVALYCLGMACLMLYGSRVYKVAEADRLLDQLRLRGDEQILDAGCGGGMMMILAARRLQTGHAVGIDLWQASDQSDNSADTALRSADLAGVRKRVTVQTGDIRSLPFDDASFDIVLTHWVIHNLPTAEDRQKAIAEMLRVLRPDGRLLIIDITGQAEYAAVLRKAGATNIKTIGPGWREKLFGLVSFGSFKPAGVLAAV
jgi:SAM-dependent methyltransferase